MASPARVEARARDDSYTQGSRALIWDHFGPRRVEGLQVWVPREEGREPRGLGRDGRGGAVPNRRAVPQERSVGRRRGAILGRVITA